MSQVHGGALLRGNVRNASGEFLYLLQTVSSSTVVGEQCLTVFCSGVFIGEIWGWDRLDYRAMPVGTLLSVLSRPGLLI